MAHFGYGPIWEGRKDCSPRGGNLLLHDLSGIAVVFYAPLVVPIQVNVRSAIGEVLAVTDDVVDCRVEVREEGGAGRLAAATIARFRIASGKLTE